MKDKILHLVIVALVALSVVQTTFLWLLYDELETMNGYVFAYLNSIQSDVGIININLDSIEDEVSTIRSDVDSIRQAVQ